VLGQEVPCLAHALVRMIFPFLFGPVADLSFRFLLVLFSQLTHRWRICLTFLVAAPTVLL